MLYRYGLVRCSGNQANHTGRSTSRTSMVTVWRYFLYGRCRSLWTGEKTSLYALYFPYICSCRKCVTVYCNPVLYFIKANGAEKPPFLYIFSTAQPFPRHFPLSKYSFTRFCKLVSSGYSTTFFNTLPKTLHSASLSL